jgi:hypothetical protein
VQGVEKKTGKREVTIRSNGQQKSKREKVKGNGHFWKINQNKGEKTKLPLGPITKDTYQGPSPNQVNCPKPNLNWAPKNPKPN